MSLLEINRNPSFRQAIRASGHGEVWTHSSDDFKLSQFGWRCNNKESGYNNRTLNGNWNEERWDRSKALLNQPLPSDFNHYYETSSYTSFSKVAPQIGFDDPNHIQKLRRVAGKLPLCFPGHHPEYDSDISRELSNSFMTTSRCAYVDPRLRKEPIKKSSFAVDTPK